MRIAEVAMTSSRDSRDSLEMTSLNDVKTQEGGFILLGDPGDKEEENLGIQIIVLQILAENRNKVHLSIISVSMRLKH